MGVYIYIYIYIYIYVVVPVRSSDHLATVVAAPTNPTSSRESIETTTRKRQLPLFIVLRQIRWSLNKWPALCTPGSHVALPRGSD